MHYKVKDKKWVITLQTVMGNYLENITSKMSNYHEKRHLTVKSPLARG